MSYSKSKPSNYVTKEQIERARNVDMVEFLERTEGFSVKKSGNGYRCDVHDSLFITNDRKGWYWNSRDEGGNNAIAFCMKIYGQKNKVSANYMRIERNVFGKNLTAIELRLYILIIKSLDSKLGYCFKSFNDLADELRIKRDTAMKIISNLVNLRLIRKQRKMRYDNSKVYADNSYSTKVIRFIRKRNKPGSHPGLISFKNIHKHTDNPTITELNSLCNYNNAISTICQVGLGAYSVIFFKSRGSPRNLRSIQYPVILPSERKKILYIRI